MAIINILSEETIDQIAAGEVIERPSSIVKELVENSIDAGASAVTVEIKDGGCTFIRVADNGSGIEKSQIRKAFLRHATSKIADAGDLAGVTSLGFRGEALSSIAAVSYVELITKTHQDLSGVRVTMEGPTEIDFEDVGAPDGTCIIVRNLFFNVPVRKKFLKSPQTETSYISELMEHFALAHPDVSFQFLVGGKLRFSTPGNGNLKQVIYTLYGRDTAENLLPINRESHGITLQGFLGEPSSNRATRSYELYFLNGRFIKSNVICKAIEDAYKGFVMMHKFPFLVVRMSIDPALVDVNVHPTKKEVRFSEGATVYDAVYAMVSEVLHSGDMVPEVLLSKEEKIFEQKPVSMPMQHTGSIVEKLQEMTRPVTSPVVTSKDFQVSFDEDEDEVAEQGIYQVPVIDGENEAYKVEKPHQLDIEEAFGEKILTADNREKFRVIGQIFDTYWLVEFEEKLLLVDQHAAHEKVNFERFMKSFEEKAVLTQNLYPPIVVHLSGKEQQVLLDYMEAFTALGFTIDPFGGDSYTISTVPVDLYGNNGKDYFLEVLDSLSDGGVIKSESAYYHVATMACKASIKGNMKVTREEMEELLDQMLSLDNPYFCPHGRPTMIYFTQTELEKRFKRIQS